MLFIAGDRSDQHETSHHDLTSHPTVMKNGELLLYNYTVYESFSSFGR